MFIKLPSLHQTGDTMVEVLMAMAVVSVILGGAYFTTNRSILATRDAQEHVDALKLADAQLELLNAQPPSSTFLSSYGSGFCYIQSSGTYTPQAISAQNCTVTSQGLALPTPTYQPAYNIKVTYASSTVQNQGQNGNNGNNNGKNGDQDGNNGNHNGNNNGSQTFPMYTVQISWASVTGGNGQIEMFYRTGK